MKYLSSTCLVLAGVNFLIFSSILDFRSEELNLYFLDVGQGDSQLVMLPGGAKVLIDAGPGKSTLDSLFAVLPPTDRYIDIVLLTHPQLDHYGGFIEILRRFEVGVFIYNGRDGTTAAWENLKQVIEERKIKTIILKEGDSIINGASRFDFLMPNDKYVNAKELNDAMLVAKLTSEGSKTLFTGDIGFKNMNSEGYLVKNHDIDVDILKVGHHGSKHSSSREFLEATSPVVSIVQVGEGNTYGHPTKEVLGRLANIGSSLYRTDRDKTVRLRVKNGLIEVLKSH